MNHKKHHLILWGVIAGVTLGFITACSPAHQDIQAWMDSERKHASTRIAPVPKPQAFEPASYLQKSAIDPFEQDRLTSVLMKQSQGNDYLIQGEINRQKEPLESFSLDTLSMVGNIQKAGQQIALVKANNHIYQIKVGNYLGKDFGKVVKITEDSIDLREIVQDSSGGWSERNSVLQIQESQEKSK